jgi:hypothetical protein
MNISAAKMPRPVSMGVLQSSCIDNRVNKKMRTRKELALGAKIGRHAA